MTAPKIYTDPSTGQQYWWDGTQWQPLPATSAVQPGYGAQYAPGYNRGAGYVPPRVAVSKTRKDTSHLFHLVMTILTGGVWGLLVWLPITIWHKTGPRKKTVTRQR